MSTGGKIFKSPVTAGGKNDILYKYFYKEYAQYES